MSKAPYMPLFVDAYIADTKHLSTEESGAYLHLLMGMWRNDGWLIDNDKQLARITGLGIKRWRSVRQILEPLLLFVDGKVSQKRLQKEWDHVSARSQKQSENAQSRWLKNKGQVDATAYAKAMPNAYPHTHTHTHKEKKIELRAKARRARSLELALQENWFPENLSASQQGEFEKFCDHFRANGKPMKDWSAAWRNWVRRAPEFSARRGTGDVKTFKQMAWEQVCNKVISEIDNESNVIDLPNRLQIGGSARGQANPRQLHAATAGYGNDAPMLDQHAGGEAVIDLEPDDGC